MRTEHLSILTLVAGIVGVAGCSSSDPGAVGTGGMTGALGASGGTLASGSGGVVSTGGTGQSVTGGTNNTGGMPASGGSQVSGGTQGVGGATAATGGASNGGAGTTGGSSTMNAGGKSASGGAIGAGGASTGGRSGGVGGAAAGGSNPVVGGASGAATGGRVGTGGAGGGATTGGSINTGTCTASKATGTNATGSGPHKVTVETNSDPGISEGTIFRPTDLGGAEKYPIFAWGEGGCSLNGLSNSAAMAEIASHGYFVIADGTPNGSGSRSMDNSNPVTMGKPLLAYITWAIAENDKPCSAYYQSLNTTKISTNGFSCGGLMAEGTAGDPRITTWALNSSGMFAVNQTFYKTIHTPVLLVEGGPSDMAYENGLRDYDNISALGIPILFFSKDIGHGGDLFSARGGDFTKINLAWLNWHLKGDETATGKGLLVGSGCTYCTNSAWEVKSANVQ